CNRLFPQEITDPHFKAWKEAQAQHLELIHECFDPLPLFTAPLFEREMGGLDLLRKLGLALYGEHDPAGHLFSGLTQDIESDGAGGYLMRIPLGFAEKEKLDLFRSTDELTLTVGSYRRNLALPRALWPLEVGSAKLNEG